jgi:thiol-disulfide isomerase/thioredoxin
MKAVELKKETKQDFMKNIKSNTPSLVLYHAEWCPHCVALQPAWKDVKKELEKNQGIVVMEVEYTNMKLLPPQYQNIRGFPTIEVFNEGHVKSEYTGDRSKSSIVDFAVSHAKKVEKKPKASDKKKEPAKPAPKKPAAKKA